MPLFYPGAQPFSFGVIVTMPKETNPNAAAESLVSFTFNLPADLAELFTKAAEADEITEQQAAGIAAASYLAAACADLKLANLDTQAQQRRVSDINVERVQSEAHRRAEVQLILSMVPKDCRERISAGLAALSEEFFA